MCVVTHYVVYLVVACKDGCVYVWLSVVCVAILLSMGFLSWWVMYCCCVGAEFLVMLPMWLLWLSMRIHVLVVVLPIEVLS